MADNVWGITYAGRVHLHLSCESCEFETWDYLGGIKEAEAHHKDTGHEMEGEQGSAVWIGNEGTVRLKDRAKRILGDSIVDGIASESA